MVMVEESEVPVWYWGKSNKETVKHPNGNIFQRNGKNPRQNDIQFNQPIPPSKQPDEDIIEPTPPVHPMFKVPVQKRKDSGDANEGRGRSRSKSESRKRSLSRGKAESPSKVKPSLEKLSQTSTNLIPSQTNLFPTSTPEEASGKDREVA